MSRAKKKKRERRWDSRKPSVASERSAIELQFASAAAPPKFFSMNSTSRVKQPRETACEKGPTWRVGAQKRRHKSDLKERIGNTREQYRLSA